MSVIEEVRREREDLARVLKKHAGIRKIVEDLYPDRAHFIYELLQNAEDTGATEAEFTLSESSLTFEHNGRPFDVRDLFAITDIGEGSKAEDKIGRFGLGFKAVFAYCETPHVWSPTFCFKISDLVLPTGLDGIPDLGCRTRFVFPFNNPKKTPSDAYREIDAGLNELAETTLLFLSHLNTIRWHIGGTTSGRVAKTLHSQNHVEIGKEVAGTRAASHFLRFQETAEGLDSRRVAVAFELDYLPDVQGFDAGKALHTQLKIIPASPGRVAVFFPADKETSGLRFHLHAPFVPELSRASIKETPANGPLFQQLARLTAASLHEIRALDLLTVEFLGALPNPRDPIPERYRGICSSIIEEMTVHALTPTNSRRHAPAKHLLQGRTALKELLSDADVQLLAGSVEEPRQWAASASVDNLNATRFLEGLRITVWDVGDFVQLLSSILSEGQLNVDGGISGNAMKEWFYSRPKEWVQKLYGMVWAEYLNVEALQRHRRAATLKSARIVRCRDGVYRIGRDCFFPDDGGDFDDGLPRVDKDVYSSGNSRNQREGAARFLGEIGVREAGEAEQIEQILKQRYTMQGVEPRANDLSRFVSLVEEEPLKARLFGEYLIFKCRDGVFRRPGEVFLDLPFLDTGLSALYVVGAALDNSYSEFDVGLERLTKFARMVRVRTSLAVRQATCQDNPSWSALQGGGKSRRRNRAFIDRDFDVVEFEGLLRIQGELTSRLIWLTMINVVCPEHLLAKYQHDRQSVPRDAPSRLVHRLISAAWVPQTDGRFVQPAHASSHLLPEGFSFDSGWPWIKAIKFGDEIGKKSQDQRQLDTAAQLLGIKNLERTQRFELLPAEEQERVLADWEQRQSNVVPEEEPADPERRDGRVAAEAAGAPKRTTVLRTRSVSVGREEVKGEAEPYLRQRYTQEHGMICQVCKTRLPFKLDDGSDFFMKVEFLTELTGRHYQNYLALCPNHAAMFQWANGSTKSMLEDFVELTGNELPVVLGQEKWTIYFTTTHIRDLRKVIAADRTPQEQPLDAPEDAGPG